MQLFLPHSKLQNNPNAIAVSGSKSETNRLLLLQALYPSITIQNSSNADDSTVMAAILQKAKNSNNGEVYDVHHAGTAMRFLTAFFAIQEDKEVVLTGSTRMQERPIQVLVDALQQLGAEIEYLEKEGFPPLRIKGKKIKENKVTLAANVSSQYISALLLIAPKLENGLELVLQGTITSMPYIQMTLALLQELGAVTSLEGNVIKVASLSEAKVLNTKTELVVESDWSSASYWYSIVALSEVGTQITLSSYKKNSLQGDAALATIYQDFGVETTFHDNNTITIEKKENPEIQEVIYDLNHCPDIAQTIAVSCFGLGIACVLTGLHTLKIKETDRLEALREELTKLGADISVTNDSLTLGISTTIKKEVSIATYQDHRMAMAFAPLALRTSITIQEAEVVSKSYPNFWKDLKEIGFSMHQES